MKRLVLKILDKFGYFIISKNQIKKYSIIELENRYPILRNKVDYIKAHTNEGLKQKLLDEDKTRWLEIGCGGTFDENFTYIDLFPDTIVNKKGKYFRIDIANSSAESLKKIGSYDLIRMQHVFEHFTPEDGRKVLDNCALMLNPEGYILITTPDLKKYINFYLTDRIRNDFEWALNRIERESPNSFYFSIYSHSLIHEKHEWCYDAEGLIYQLEYSKKFKNIREIPLDDELANIPFTHNRPNEDVCVIAQLN